MWLGVLASAVRPFSTPSTEKKNETREEVQETNVRKKLGDISADGGKFYR